MFACALRLLEAIPFQGMRNVEFCTGITAMNSTTSATTALSLAPSRVQRLSTSRYGFRCPAFLFNLPPLWGQGLRSPAGGRSPGLGGGASLKAGQRNSYLEVERRSFPKGHSRGMARAEEERRGRRGAENIGRGRRCSFRMFRVFRACSCVSAFCLRCSALFVNFVLRSCALRLAVR